MINSTGSLVVDDQDAALALMKDVFPGALRGWHRAGTRRI